MPPTAHKNALTAMIVLLSSFAFNCGDRSRNNNDQIPELSFKINPALLEKRFGDDGLSFSFQPPKGCIPVSMSLFKQAGEKIVREYSLDGSFAVEPRNLFLNQKERLICLVSGLPKQPSFPLLLKGVQHAIDEWSKKGDVKVGAFTHRGLEIRQILLMSREQVNFKLVVLQSGVNSFQIDYVIPQKSYKNNLEAIESSIGSIEKLKKEEDP
jgi:hypothetical protein